MRKQTDEGEGDPAPRAAGRGCAWRGHSLKILFPHYLTAQWPKLARYVDDGRYPIDNNACENAIRPFCIGRRNWLFADTVAGANAGANLYSLLQTCMANGIDGYRYLRALLVELPRAKTFEDFEALLPWRLVMAER